MEGYDLSILRFFRIWYLMNIGRCVIGGLVISPFSIRCALFLGLLPTWINWSSMHILNVFMTPLVAVEYKYHKIGINESNDSLKIVVGRINREGTNLKYQMIVVGRMNGEEGTDLKYQMIG